MATTTDLSFNKKIGVVKLLLSSLYARKQAYLILNGEKRNRLIYTNIDPLRVKFYKSDIDDTMGVVKLTDKATDVLYEIFPLFKQVIACVDLSALMAAMNKSLALVKANPNIVVDNCERLQLIMPHSDTDPVPYGDASYNVEVGQLITDDTVDAYERIFARFMDFSKEEPVVREVTIPSADADYKVVLSKVEIPNSRNNCDVFLNLPIQDGTSVVSFKEYLTKQKMPWKYSVNIQYDDRKSVARVAYLYRDDLVDTVTIAPGALWFPYRKR